MNCLRLILGDQLNQEISSLSDCDKSKDILLMCEVWEEARYVKHHKKKIAFIFSAMRHFAAELLQNGYRLDYVRLDEKANTGSFRGEVERAIKRHNIKSLVVTFPGEFRVLQELQSWENALDIDIEIREDTRFLCSLDQFSQWSKGRKQLRMEYFYREMRRTNDILMEGDQPIGGQWNYDADNRKPVHKSLNIPPHFQVIPDSITLEVLALVAKHFVSHFGDLEPFYFVVTREQSLAVLEHFIDKRLSLFGDYQDAMLEGEPWMYHAHISFYLNCGLLQPLECIQAAEASLRAGSAPINAVEGFIRQIIGWREYVRGIYWLSMPSYAELNFLNAKRPLPGFYWTGKTEMNCLHQCIKETKHNAYAHHIQRLMVLGNFALLAGLDPVEVNEWYLIVYADAYEWVELPNVSGMILFADGGLLASKPYAAGGSYINKMSDYCKSCRYKVNLKNGSDACPFNYLYWDFLARNSDKLASNPRLSMMYKNFARMDAKKQEDIRRDSEKFLKKLSSGKL